MTVAIESFSIKILTVMGLNMSILKSRQSGIAAVEFLITLPVLLLILTIIVEFGNAFISYNTLSKTVQNAARYSVRDVYGTADPYAVADFDSIKNMVVYGNKTQPAGDNPPVVLDGLETSNVQVTIDGKYVVVTASYTYSPILNFLPLDSLLDLTFSSSALLRTEP